MNTRINTSHRSLAAPVLAACRILRDQPISGPAIHVTRTTRLASAQRTRTRAVLGVVLGALLLDGLSARATTMVQDFYLPIPESQLALVDTALVSGTYSTIYSITPIVVTGDGTVVHYDQWEDGYETDLANPTQSSTKVWGDGNDANGIAPGFAHDPAGLTSGTVIMLTNNVTLPRNPATLLYDARDRVAANKALSVSRAAWPASTGPVFAGMANVLSTADCGTNYISPVGQDLTNNLFKYVGMFILANQNNTAVTIDPAGTGVGRTNIVLNQGESWLVHGGIKKGGRVTSTKPVQADLVIGHVGASYALDLFTLYPVEAWDSTYYTPVCSASNGNPAYVYLFNANTNAITVNYATQARSGSVVIAGTNGVYQFLMPAGSGASFINTNGQNFFAICTAGANNASDTAYNWGFSLVPKGALTPEVVVGWGPGSASSTANGNPVWVTTLGSTRIYVDYKGDRAGPLTDPRGNKYDTNFDLVTLQARRIFDPGKDQTGMRIYTLDGTLLTAAWGQDPDVAAAGNPYIDAGTTVLPFPVPKITKTTTLYSDSGNPGATVGDILQYTVEVDNKGLAPIGNLVVIDAPSTNLAYVAGSTTLDGNSIADNTTGTPFPLDASGYVIPVILQGGTSTFQYLCMITAPGAITNTAGATANNQTITTQTGVVTPSTNAPVPVCFINFTDLGGVIAASYVAGDTLYVTLTNAAANTSATTVQTVTIVVQDSTSGDYETVVLTETGINTGVFTLAGGLPTSTTGGLAANDGTLRVTAGDVLNINYTDPTYGSTASASATITAAFQTKVLYLSGTNAPDQTLDRIDPATTSDSATAQTVALGQGAYQTIGVDNTTSGASATNNFSLAHTVGSGPNRLMLVGISYTTNRSAGTLVTNVTYGGVALTQVVFAVNTSSSTTRPRSEIWQLVNPPSGTASLLVKLAGGSPTNLNVGIMTFSNVNQTTPIGYTGKAATRPGSSAPYVASVKVTSNTNSLVLAVLSSALTTYTERAGQTERWHTNTLKIRAIGCTKPGATSVTNSWTGSSRQYYAATAVSINPSIGAGTLSATFGQSPAFCQDFTLPAGGTVKITNWITVTSGTMPTNPVVTATLLNGSGAFMTLNNPTVGSGTNSLIWSGSLSAAVTIPSGQSINYVISNGQSGVNFKVRYDSTTNASKIVLPTTTVIAAQNVAVYDAPYPAGAVQTAPYCGQTAFVRVQVSDPFGSYDVSSVRLVIDGPGTANDISTTLTNAHVVADSGCVRTYEYVWQTGATVGGYTLTATAYEGSEGVTNATSTAVTLNFLDLGTPSTTVFTSGNNGIRTNSYATNSTAWIRVVDVNRNTNTTTADTVTVTVTGSGGDSELLVLTETGTNTGVFTGGIRLTNSATAGNSGALTAPQGSTLQVTYSDPTDSTDVTSDTAAVPTAPGTGAIQVTATLLTASPTVVSNTVQFNIQVVNTGSTNLPTVVLTNSFPTNALAFLSASLAPGTISGTNLVWNNIGPLAAGQSTNIVLTFTALSSASPATDAASASSGTGVTGSSSALVTITRPALTLTKTRLSPTNDVVSIGSNVVFEIVLRNTGDTVIPTIPLEDDFSATTFQYVSATIPPSGAGAGLLTWTNIATNALAVNASITNWVTMQVAGEGFPANNTVRADYAVDVNSNSVPSAPATASQTNAAVRITGSVFEDADQSGTLTPGDTGIGNITVRLYSDPNGDGDPGDGVLVQVTTTDSSGYYEFLNLPTGHYVVVETDPAGYISVAPVSNRIAINASSLTTLADNRFFDYINRTIATISYATVSGHVWFDANQNGVKDTSESGVTNALVDLVQDVNTNGLADVGEPVLNSAYTDTNGLFAFENVVPGNYVARENDLYGWASTADSQGANDNQVMVAVAGSNVTNVWFLDYTAGGGNGYYPPVAAPDSFPVLENQTLTVAAAQGIFANDFCTSGISNLTAIVVATTTNGTLTLNTNTGAFLYVPATNFNGTDAFSYRVSDGTTNSAAATVTITVAAVNQPPAFTPGAAQNVLEDAGAQSVTGWATGISAGPANESGQTLVFHVSNNNSGLFSVAPAIASDGTLTYTPAANANGSATVSVYLQDNGGTANGGVNVSTTNTFTITVTPVNDPPSYALSTNNVAVLEDSGAKTNTGFLTGISVGPANESGQTLEFLVSNNSSNLFSAQPVISTNGTLTFTPAANASGVATVTVFARDNGGTDNGGNDTSTTNTFTITVTAVNDPPALASISNQTILEDAGTQTVALSGISAGPEESGQTLTITATSSNPGLIPNPSVSYTNGNATGVLSYAPTANSNGMAVITIVVQDNGGTAGGGVSTITNTFTVTVTPVNDAPSFVKGIDLSVNQKAGAQSLTNWATLIRPGPADESGQVVTFVVTNDANALFTVQPQLSSNGTLTFTPATNANARATITVIAHDNGGTDNGGVDTSAPQTFIIDIGNSELIRATGGEAISADTVGRAWTTLTGPSYVEGNSGAIGAGTIILQIPPGFEFDTGGVAPTVLMQRNDGTGDDSLNINGATNGQALAVTSVTSTQIVFTITSASSGLVSDTLTWQNIRVRPTSGSLPAGEMVITATGTAVIQQIQPDVTSWGTLAEVPGTPAQLVVGTEPSSTATAGTTFIQQPVIRVEDAYGNLVTNATGTVKAARDAGDGVLQGTLTAEIINGIATFTNLSHLVATHITIAFTSQDVTGTTSTVVSVQAAAADHLVMVQGNYQTNTVATALTVNPTVRVVDAWGNPVSGTTVAFSVLLGGGSVSDTTAVSDADGLAATVFTLGTASGVNNNTLQASASGVTGSPSSLTFTESSVAGAATQLVIQTEPSSTATAGSAFAQQPVVLVEDAYGNVVTGASGYVTAARDAGSGTLQGNLTIPVVNGVATFTNLSHLVATNITIDFASGSLTPATSTVVAVSAGAANHLVRVQGDNQTNTVASLLPVNPTVRVVDAYGNPVSGVTVTFAVQTGGGSTGSTNVVTDSDGLAATTYRLGTTAGSGNNTLQASATVSGSPSSVSFTESALAGTATHLAIHTEPSATATAGVNFAQEPVIWVVDAYGNLVTNATGIVTATRNAGSGTLQGTTVATIVNGVATFTDLHHNVAGDITLNFASGSFATVTSTPVTIQAAAADHLVLVQGNNQTATVATAVDINPTVRVVDAFGNPVSGTGVSFAVQTGGGHVGTATVISDTNGLAATSYALGTVAGATNNTLLASTTLTGTPSSLTFTESAVAGTASKLAIYTQPSPNAIAGIDFTNQPVVCVQDAFGNIVTNATGIVTAARATGSGDLQGTLEAEIVNGFATFTDLSHNVATNITLAFSSGILAPVTSSSISVKADVADHLVLVTGDGQTGRISSALPVNPTVRVVDAYENPVSGSLVTFVVTGGGGSVSPTSAYSDANGLVLTTYTLGGTVGTGNNTMDARLGNLDTYTFTESAATTGLPVADVSATVTGPAEIGINQQILYQITVQNLGPSNAVGIVLTNLLPAGVSVVSAPGAAGTNSSEVWWNIGTLPSGASSNVTLTVTAPGVVSTLSDTVFSVSPAYDPQAANNDGSAAGATVVTAVQSADLVAAISGPASAFAGTNLVYTVSITNLGPSTAAGVVLTNRIPAGFTVVDAGDGTVNGTLVTWNLGALAAGGWDTFTLILTPPATGGSFTNIAACGATTYDPSAANNNGTSAPGYVTTTVTPLNVAPTLNAISGVTINEDAGSQTVNLSGITAGGGASQTLTVTATSSSPGVVPNPTVSYTSANATGSLSFTPVADAFGSATITVVVRDDGGTINGGVNAMTNTFVVTVNSVNDTPGFTGGASMTNVMNCGAITMANWATNISVGPANESGQTASFIVSNNNTAIFSAQPALSSGGTLTFTPAANASGIATVTVWLKDNGGVANGGVDTSAPQTFTIMVEAYSIGNRVFSDLNNNGVRDFGEAGISGVRMLLFTNNAGNPSGSLLMATNTDANGDYRFDNVPAGSFVVVVDVANSPNLAHHSSSAGSNTDMTLTGDQKDHGRDAAVTVTGALTNGIASTPVTVGPGLQPVSEVVANPPGAGRNGLCGDAYDNLVVDFSFTPTFSLGNRVFYDDNHDGVQAVGEPGVSNVPMHVFAADSNGRPTGSPLASTTTDADGWYRLDDLMPGTYVVVLDKSAATNLAHYTLSPDTSTNVGSGGDLFNHGLASPLVNLAGITNGCASSPVTLGPGLQPSGEATNGVSGAGAHGPNGDDYDNLVLDFGFSRTYCIGNRVFADDGSGGGTANNGIQDGSEAGIPNVALRLFAADTNGLPAGDALVTGTNNLDLVLTDTNGFYTFAEVPAGSYVVVVDVELSKHLHGYTNIDGVTCAAPGAFSSSLVGFMGSTGCSTNLTLAGDLLDHGRDGLLNVGSVTNGVASVMVTVDEGLQPTGEYTNAVTGPGAHGVCGDENDNLVIDFGFAPTFSIGNRIFADNGRAGATANNGQLDTGELGIASVLVQLRTNGVAMAATNTDASGYYRFDNLQAGSYTVFVPASNFSVSGPLAGMLSSYSTQAGDSGDKGVDEASPAANGVATATITLGPGSQPSGETDIASGAGAHGLNGDGYDNLTIDFGFIEANDANCSVGSLVWHDANNNGLYDAGESGIAGVTVELWNSDADGVLYGGAPVATNTTAVDGTYIINNVPPGIYRLRIPAGMFDTGQPLHSMNTASTWQHNEDGHVDGNNNGIQSAANQRVLSPVLTLSRGGEPVDGSGAYDESGPGASQDNVIDANGDMTMDFGFYSPADDQAGLCSLGSLVWNDTNNNGFCDTNETGIAGVTVELYQTNNAGLVLWASTTTSTNGLYFFDSLPSGSNWVVHIPATNFTTGGALFAYPVSGGTPTNADNQTDNDNNGLQPGGLGTEVWSPVINLAAGAEPTSAETGPGYLLDNTGSYVDANGDMTVSFGFTPTFSIGNRVFADLNNNGVMDGSDSGIIGVVVKLFADDGSGGPTGLALATATTDANGFYRFDNLVKGSYVVVVDQANSPNLSGSTSSTGASADMSLSGDAKDHGRDTLVNVDTVVNGIASAAVTIGEGSQPSGESTGPAAGANGLNGDASDNLVVDFGFTPTYSIGNKIYRDPDNDGQPDLDKLDEGGISGVHLGAFAADESGNPTGSALATATTDSEGFYRLDGLVAGTYVVVVDKTNSPALDGFVGVRGVSLDTSLSGDLYDHGKDTLLGAESVMPGGIASTPVTLGPGLQPVNEATGPGEAANGPTGDANDNLVIDFGMMPLYSIGNRVFLDNGAGSGGVRNDGIQNGDEPGISNVVVKLFAADASGNPTGTEQASTNTDVSGYYRFDGIDMGTHVVVVDKANSSGLSGLVSSTSFNSSTRTAGDRKDHGMDVPVSVGSVVNGIASVPVTLGENGLVAPLNETDIGDGAGAHGPNTDDSDNLVLDFGFAPAASVSGNVLVDVNGNGVFDTNDITGVAGVTLVLQTTNGVPVMTNTTASDGTYVFTNVPPGDYIVVETDLPGWLSTADSSAPNDNQIPVTLISGVVSADNNFLDTQPGSIAGSVLVDVDNNGVFDAADTNGVGGVTVVLQTTNSVPVATNVTSVSGAYVFTDVPPGDYIIVETDLPGWLSTADTSAPNDNQVPVSLASNQAWTGGNFLDTRLGGISGSVRVDANADGVLDAADTTGISGVTVVLQTTNGVPVATNITSVSGVFTFADVIPGSYVIVETDKDGWFSTGDSASPSDNHVPVTITSGQMAADSYFLDAQNAGITGSVILDANGNGIPDLDDTNTVSPVVVRIYDNGSNLVATLTNDLTGAFNVTDLPPGLYHVAQTVPTGYLATTPPTVDVTLTSGSTGTAGFLDTPTFSIGNCVFADNGAGGGTANNGIQDGFEPGIASVVVKCFTADDYGNPTNSALIITNTDANGHYRFDGLQAGTYVVVVDVAASGSALSGMLSSTGCSTDLTSAGDLKDHGLDTVMSEQSILPGGIASMPVTVGYGLQPINEATGSGAGGSGPAGDANDILVVDFGFHAQSPTAAMFGWLGAYVDQGRVWVKWQTLSELGVIFYDVTRTDASGAMDLVTGDPVFADGVSAGHAYKIEDLTAALPGTYTYTLTAWNDDDTIDELATVTVSLSKDAGIDVIHIVGVEAGSHGVRVRWTGGQPPYVLQTSPLPGSDAEWTPVGPAQAGQTEAVVPAGDASGFFRVLGADEAP
jgi:uncharacterized repeat protein (TIGR01451 family)